MSLLDDFDEEDEEIEDDEIDVDEFEEVVDEIEGISYDELADIIDDCYVDDLSHADIVEELIEVFDISKDGAERAIRIYNAEIDGEF
jgi:hypothetical protein